MSNELSIPGMESGGQLAALRELFGGVDNTDLTTGVSASFPVLSFKGKTWRVRIKGEEKMVLTEDGDPVSSLNAVIVKASPNISKIFYAKTYQEGDDESPDCFSVDGVKPDPSVTNPVNNLCATCPKNQWGSRISDNGQKLKACSDSRRLAVVPYPDIDNGGNGPMLLRVPPASLGALASFAEKLGKVSVPYSAIVVKIGFEHDLAYPKLTFKAARVLDEQEARRVLDYQTSDQVDSIFAEAHPVETEGRSEAPAAAADTDLDAGPEEKAKPAEKATEKPEEKPAEKAEEKPAEEKPSAKAQAMDQGEEVGAESTDTLDNLLSNVLDD